MAGPLLISHVLDRSPEYPLYPNASLDLGCYNRVAVLAPHPDDEIYGCGGLLRLFVERGATVKVVVITNGEKGGVNEKADVIDQRRTESFNAASVIGYPPPEFLDFEDRKLSFGEKLIDAILARLHLYRPDLVLTPSITERHPDHQVAALATVEALRRIEDPATLACYEVSATLIPTALVNISTVLPIKERAMDCFASQEATEPYKDRILALNRYRAYSLGANVAAAEAFHLLSTKDLRTTSVGLLTPIVRLRRRESLALDPAELPLISVIIRSLNRPSLDEALASVVAQTYPRIEIIVVDATGGKHRSLPEEIETRLLRIITSTHVLSRGEAANVGLDAAKGDEFIFLDDDDVFYPHHIERLVHARIQHPHCIAAYAGVEVIDLQGTRLLTYDEPWDKARLILANYLPIHAVLFSREAVILGCRIDESLAILEDWDFWLQLSQHTDFCHVPGVSALYHYSETQSAHAQHYREWRKFVVTKWQAKIGFDPFEKSLYWAATNYDHASQSVVHLKRHLANIEDALGAAREDLRAAKDDCKKLAVEREVLAETQEENRVLREQVELITRENRALDDILHSRPRRILQYLSRLLNALSRHQIP